ncbi:MAG: RNase P subunit p30 family protein [Candidatus Thorarchaeota archaeon]
MIPFFDSSIVISNENTLNDFDVIAKKIGLYGFLILGQEYQHTSLKTPEHISRLEIESEKVNEVRDLLLKKRSKCEIMSIKTSNAKVAQWVVKDSRVDILSIPVQNMKEIITKQLANVAAENNTFIEIDLSPIIYEKDRKSIIIRNLLRSSHILVQQKVPIAFTMRAQTPFQLRDIRTIISLAKVIGISKKYVQKSILNFSIKVFENKKKFFPNVVSAYFIRKSDEVDKIEELSPTNKEEENGIILPDLFIDKEIPDNDLTFERQRYILFEILSKELLNITEKDIESEIWRLFNQFYGIIGSSRVGLYLSSYNKDKQMGILRCNHKALDAIRIVLASIVEMENQEVQFHVMQISGTMKKFVTKMK